MPRACSICTHPQRNEIDKCLVVKESYRRVASRFGTSTASLKRHVDAGHITTKIQSAKEILDLRHGVSLIEKLTKLEEISLNTIHEATAEGNLRVKCSAIREYRATLELTGKASGEYVERREISGKDGGPIQIDDTRNQLINRIRIIAESRRTDQLPGNTDSGRSTDS